MVTTRRVRHGIVLTLAGLLAGLGIVGAVYWGGVLPHRDEPEARNRTSALSPDSGPGDAQGTGTGTGTQGPGPQGSGMQGPGSAGQSAEEGAREAGKDVAAGTNPESRGRTDGTPPAKDRQAAEATEAPRFDIVRIEPNGDAVVAGRGKPNTVVEMLVDGKPVARALADPDGQFAIVPPPLPKGSSEIVLRSRTADGRETRSAQSVAVSVSPDGSTRPLVALTAPNAPTIVLSQPGAPETPPAAAGTAQATAGGATAGTGTDKADRTAEATDAGRKAPGPREGQAARIVSVDAEPGGRLYVTGAGKPGTELRLYLNDTLIAPGKVGPDGRVTFTIGRGVAEGRYQVRLDEIDPANGRVVRRAEVPFTMPQVVASAAPPPRGGGGGPAGPGSPAGQRETAGAGSGHAGADTQAPGRTGIAAGTPEPGSPPASSTAGRGKAGQGAETMAANPPVADPPAAPSVAGPPGGGSGPVASTGDIRTSAVFVPGIATARIIRGDNLWQISKRTYGRGERYTVIYDANQAQIRDPDLIYPGQIFVLPQDRRG